MRGGGVVPPGRAGLLMLAVAVVPIAVRHCKPAVRAVGKGISRVGAFIEDLVGTSEAESKSEESMTVPKTDTASPATQDEIIEQEAAQEAGADAPPEPKPKAKPKPKPRPRPAVKKPASSSDNGDAPAA